MGVGAAVVALAITLAVGSAMAGAATSNQTQTPPATPQARTAAPKQSQAKTNYRNFFLDRLAADLSTTRDKLNSAFIQARNETVDQEVKDGKLTQQRADKIKASPDAGPAFGFGAGRGADRFDRGERGLGFMGRHHPQGKHAPMKSDNRSKPAA